MQESHLPLAYLFAFSYCSWDSQGKNTGVVCHSLLWQTTFSQNSSLWPIHLGWLCTSWLIASLNYTFELLHWISPFATQGCVLWRGNSVYLLISGMDYALTTEESQWRRFGVRGTLLNLLHKAIDMVAYILIFQLVMNSLWF